MVFHRSRCGLPFRCAIKLLECSGNFLPDLLNHLISHRVVIDADGGPDPCKNIFGVGAVMGCHRFDRRPGNPGESPDPACVSQADHFLYGVVEQDRNAVSETHIQGHFRPVGQDDVRLLIWRFGGSGSFDENGLGAVHQPGIVHAVDISPKSSQRPPPVLQDILNVIPDGRPRV